MKRRGDSAYFPALFLGGDVSHIAQDLRDCPLPSGPWLELNDDGHTRCIASRNVDGARVYGTLRTIVDDGQARLKLVDLDSQRRLHVALQTDPLANLFLDRCHKGGTKLVFFWRVRCIATGIRNFRYRSTALR